MSINVNVVKVGTEHSSWPYRVRGNCFYLPADAPDGVLLNLDEVRELRDQCNVQLREAGEAEVITTGAGMPSTIGHLLGETAVKAPEVDAEAPAAPAPTPTGVSVSLVILDALTSLDQYTENRDEAIHKYLRECGVTLK